MENDESDVEINAFLAKQYGYATGDKSTPWYRVVRADTQIEKRFGKFNVFLDGTDIFLRTEVGVKEVPKYWNYPGCWVIEKWMIFPQIDGELLDNKRYEPIWVLHVKNKPMPLNKRVVEEIVYFAQTGKSKTVPENQKQADDAEIAKLKAEGKKDRQILDDQISFDQVKIRDGSTTFLPGKEVDFQKGK